ncbi:PQQ-like beta-propeller repeat protein [Phenylobacterium sp.]|uniref:PQQ-like beta-propeller repeat protein n=1 Tax=Phenylobacterium sp. TaxID=1871053 RepID=UPI0027365E03|nr:PQQ-binding-like beta-propeller repeat protein [Phenylobacterium sp.]MDP3853283.1 PQQ-binding-like beta-propeller repeat protein [Phenylobacterium sp.]
MTPMRRNSLLVLLLAASVTVGGCSTISRLNPFKGGDDGPQETAAEGERIAIVAADQTLEVAEALKGADFFLPAPAAVAEWPLPGGNAEQSVGHAEAGGNLSIAWKRGFGEGSGKGAYVTAPPVAANGKIFVMDGGANVSAFDAQSGSQVWKVSLRPDSKRDKEGFGGGLAVADGKLYVSSGYRFVAQLNADTGAVAWKTTTEQPLHAAPTVSGGRMFVVAVDNTLLTFDAATGADGWTYQGLSESARILAASSPAVSGDTVVAAFGSGELVALRAANGNDLWNEALSRANRNNALSEIRDIPGRPVIFQGDVFAVSHSGVFAATDLRTGQARWTLPVTGITSPWPAGDVVYVVSKSGEVICAARESGQIYWIRDLGVGREKLRGRGFMGMSFLGGKKKYSTRPIWSSPVLASNRIVVAGTSGELVAINAKTGEIEKTVNLGAPTLIGPIAVNGTIYVVTDEAQLIALR